MKVTVLQLVCVQDAPKQMVMQTANNAALPGYVTSDEYYKFTPKDDDLSPCPGADPGKVTSCC